MASARLMRSARVRWLVVSVTVVSVGVLALWAQSRRSRGDASEDVPTGVVSKGEFADEVMVRGEIRPLRSVVLTAPSGAGELRIIAIAKNGTTVKEGDQVIQFDTTGQRRILDDKQSLLKQADAEIEKAQAQAQVNYETNRTEVLKAEYEVERTKLDLGAAKVLPKIDAEKARLLVLDAEQKLKEMSTKIGADRVAGTADVAAMKQKREKALADVRKSEASIAAMTVRAPISGLVTIMQSRGFGGTETRREFRAGDSVWPGAPIVELPDLTSMRMVAKIDEVDRGRMRLDLVGRVKVEALPGTDYSAQVVAVSTLTKPDFSSWPPTRNFNVDLELEGQDERLRPGMTATARVRFDTLTDVLMMPVEAVFAKGSRTLAYVEKGRGFVERDVEILRRGEGQVVIARGVAAGERVALLDPSTLDPAAETEQ